MPTYYISMYTENHNQYHEKVLAIDSFKPYRNYSLSEMFNGLIGAGSGVLAYVFGDTWKMFAQIQELIQLDCEVILSCTYSDTAKDNHSSWDKYIEEAGDKVDFPPYDETTERKDIHQIYKEFKALYKKLLPIKDLESQIVQPEGAWEPDGYFKDFSAQDINQFLEEFNEDYYEEPAKTFFTDLNYVLRFLEAAIQLGDQYFYFHSR